MSFQDFDFKSDQAQWKRHGSSSPALSAFQLSILIKLTVIASAIMLLGFSVTNWQPLAKAADSTSKLSRLHYSLPLPEPTVSLHEDIARAAASIEIAIAVGVDDIHAVASHGIGRAH